MPFSIREGSRAALKGALREQGRAEGEHGGAKREHEGAREHDAAVQNPSA